jgi:V/A-type H+-transporting ATPase subunit I
MAIEPVKRIWFLVDRGHLSAFVGALARARAVHVEEMDPAEAGDALELTRLAADASDAAGRAETRVAELSRVLDVMDAFVAPKKAFHENFITLPAMMRRDDFARAVESVHVESLHTQATELQRDHARAAKTAEDRRSRIAELERWADAPVPPDGLTRCAADLGTVPPVKLHALKAAAGRAGLALDVVAGDDSLALVAAAWLRVAGVSPTESHEGHAVASAPTPREVLEQHGFSTLDLAPGSGTVGDVVDRLRRELSEAEDELSVLRKKAESLAERRRDVVAALAHWQAEVERHHASARGVASTRIAILTGYVRVREIYKVEELIARDFPSVGLVTADPQPDDDIPVSLGGSKLFAPAQFLTSMFGLPDYFAFDPSPFVFFVFVLFFGVCFSDAVYGAGLMALCLWLAGRTKHEPGLRKMLLLFAWCGGSSILFGALTGSWLSDLFAAKYLGDGPVASALIGFRAGLSTMDLMAKPILGLSTAIGIGVLMQFYGVGLHGYREIRKRNYIAAACDAGLWLVYLPSLMLLAGGLLGVLPSTVTWIAGVTTLGSALGLVLTQGRNEDTLVGRAITGVVSLYGILGSYGTTSFMSDTLSYSRLLALGLSTAVVGMVANFLGNMLHEMVPVVGVLLFVLIAVLGHSFNFLLSVLGGFVHSVRLVFLEFFSRFYEGGARPFAPLGEPQTVRVIDAD